MKKILVVISMIFSILTFSALNDGNYFASYKKDTKVYEMNILIRSNKIFLVNFDIKKENGVSIIFGNKELMNEKISIERRMRNMDNAKFIYINSDEDTQSIKKLYYFLIEKSENAEIGRYRI